MSCRRKVLFNAALWLVAAFALAGAASAEGLMQAPSGDRGWWIDEAGDQTCVRDRDGESSSCWPRSVGQPTDLRETASGWIVAGHRPARPGRELFLLRDRGDGLELLSPPAGGDLPRGRPALVTDEAQLLGLVWLEGATQATLEVRAAEWLGEDWGTVMTVSPAGPGSQVAPVVTVLDDGRWLLVWTAFDGDDDETLWSVYERGRWSTPALLHEDNKTPDIVPALVTTRKGAIAAWSWLDGRDYRLRTAFFDGSAWRPDRPAAGRGGLEPQFVASGGAYLLSFHTVVPEEWVAYELDDDGRLVHRAAIAGATGDRPRVDFQGGAVLFRWLEEGSPRQAAVAWEDVAPEKTGDLER